MKRKYIFLIGATALMLLGSCGPKLHRYSCGGKKRCISLVEQKIILSEQIKAQKKNA